MYSRNMFPEINQSAFMLVTVSLSVFLSLPLFLSYLSLSFCLSVSAFPCLSVSVCLRACVSVCLSFSKRITNKIKGKQKFQMSWKKKKFANAAKWRTKLRLQNFLSWSINSKYFAHLLISKNLITKLVSGAIISLPPLPPSPTKRGERVIFQVKFRGLCETSGFKV